MKKFTNKIWLATPTMHGDEIKYVQQAYDTNWMSTVGENINEVEKQIAELVGCKYAVALSCGTAALHLAVKLAGVKVGDKVFSTDMTFAATVNPVLYEKAEPVFIDTEYDTWNMDPAALEKAFEMYPDTKVVIMANLYGTPAKMDEICAICDKYGAPEACIFFQNTVFLHPASVTEMMACRTTDRVVDSRPRYIRQKFRDYASCRCFFYVPAVQFTAVVIGDIQLRVGGNKFRECDSHVELFSFICLTVNNRFI